MRKEYTLNDTKNFFDVCTALVLREKIWVVASCRYVTSLRHFEHIYHLHHQGCENTHNPEDEDVIFHSKRRKTNTKPQGTPTQKICCVSTKARRQIK